MSFDSPNQHHQLPTLYTNTLEDTDNQLTKVLTMRAPITIVLSALLLLTGAMGSFLNVMNKCNFPVYCSGARSDPPVGKV